MTRRLAAKLLILCPNGFRLDDLYIKHTDSFGSDSFLVFCGHIEYITDNYDVLNMEDVIDMLINEDVAQIDTNI